MQLRTFLGAVVLALSLTSCSTVQKVVYRIDVPQGNYLEAATVAQVKPGMTAQQSTIFAWHTSFNRSL